MIPNSKIEGRMPHSKLIVIPGWATLVAGAPSAFSDPGPSPSPRSSQSPEGFTFGVEYLNPAWIEAGYPEGSIFWGDAGPLRNGKGSCYEGGYRLPCTVRWPDKVPAGRVSDAIFATIDFMSTFANLAGFEVPDDRRIDGIDQTELLLGQSQSGRKHFYLEGAGVRQGRWKYLKPAARFYGYAVEDSREKVDELYDLEADLGEQVNLAEKFPEKLAELKELLESIEGKNRSTVRKKKNK